MNPLKQRLIKMIEATGPISVATYMDLCLHDRQHGYYATRPGLGSDFITAPETSQIFGELIGLWVAHEWRQLGAPASFSLIEVGPGRGTLMQDALRATQNVDGFGEAARLHFVEPSPVLRAHLRDQFGSFNPVFLDSLDQAPTEHPILVIANEWLDCLPVLQYVHAGKTWHERVVGLTDDGALTLGLSEQPAPAGLSLPDDATAAEVQPGLKTLTETLYGLFHTTPGRALFVDYGPADQTPDDTLRSYQNGKQIDPLVAPGESDLTCDVDFARLARLTETQGLQGHGPISQSQFLLALGAEARLNGLAAQHPDQADDLYAGVKKLVDPAEMGHRFQAFCISSPGVSDPAAF